MLKPRAGYGGNCRGNVTLIAAVAAIPMLLSAGAAIDYMRASAITTSLQSAVDAAALGAAASNTTNASVKRKQATQFLHDTKDFAAVEPTVEFAGDMVTVSAVTNMPTSFMGLAGLKTMEIAVTATAVTVTKPVCILSLNESADSAIAISGSGAHVDAKNCLVHANSTSAKGIDNTSNTVSEAEGFCVAGGYSGSTYHPLPKTNCRKVVDPYAGLPQPSISGCDFNNITLTTGTATLDPGVFCGGIAISDTASISFSPGTYVLKNGPLSITTSGTVIGSEVTFYFTGLQSILKLTSSAAVDLSAPKTGPYAGLVFVQNSGSPPNKSHKINGHADLKITGVGYFPKQQLSIGGSGNFGVASPFMTFVADTMEFHGNGTLTMNLDPAAAGYAVNLPRGFSGTRLTN